MRPFDAINDEVEVGYDAGFEHRWSYVEVAGRAVMLLVVAAALLGLLGQGPFSHHSVSSAASRLTIDYEPIARFGNTTQLTLHAKPRSCDQGMTIWLNSRMIEPMGLQDVEPRPFSSTPLADGMLLHYPLRPDDCRGAVVRVFAKPSGLGIIPLRARLDDGAALSWHALIVP